MLLLLIVLEISVLLTMLLLLLPKEKVPLLLRLRSGLPLLVSTSKATRLLSLQVASAAVYAAAMDGRQSVTAAARCTVFQKVVSRVHCWAVYARSCSGRLDEPQGHKGGAMCCS